MRFIEYIKGVKAEARKIIFPEPKEVRNDTLIVLGVCVSSALGLWAVSELIIKLITFVVGGAA